MTLIPHTSRDHRIIVVDVENAFEKEQCFFIIMERLELYVAYFNIIRSVDSKPIANINLNREYFKAFPLKSGTRQGCLLSVCNIVLDVLARII